MVLLLPTCVTLSSVFVFVIVYELKVSTCVTLMLQVLSAVEETPAATLLAVLIPNLVKNLNKHWTHPPSHHCTLVIAIFCLHRQDTWWWGSLLDRSQCRCRCAETRSPAHTLAQKCRQRRQPGQIDDKDDDADADHVEGVGVTSSRLDGVQRRRGCRGRARHRGGQQQTLEVKPYLWRWLGLWW